MMAKFSWQSVKLLTDFVVLSGGQLMSKVFGFVSFAYLARALGPESYGTVEYTLGLAAFSGMVVEFGLGPIGVRELAGGNGRLATLASNIPIARIFIVLSCLPIMFIAALLSHRDATTSKLVGLYALSLCAAPWNLDWLFQARDMMTRAALAQVLRMGSFTVLVFFFVSSSEHTLRVGMIEIAAATITTSYYLFTQHTKITPLRMAFSFAEVRELLREGLPIGGAQMSAAINMFAPLFLVANMAPGEETGWFGAAHRLIVSLSTFSMVYHFNLYPVLARRIVEKRTDLMDVVRASFRVVAWASLAVALGLYLVATELMQLAFGTKFAAGAPMFRVLVWFLPLTLLSGHARWLLVAVKQQRLAFAAQVSGAVATIVLGFLFVRFGSSLSLSHGAGAALGMVSAATAVWYTSHRSAQGFFPDLPGLGLAVLPVAFVMLIAGVASCIDITAWVTAPLAGIVFLAIGPLVDRKLIPDLRLLLSAKAR